MKRDLRSELGIDSQKFKLSNKKILGVTTAVSIMVGSTLAIAIHGEKEELYGSVQISMKDQNIGLTSTATGRAFVTDNYTQKISVCNYSLIEWAGEIFKLTAQHCIPKFANNEHGIIFKKNISDSDVTIKSPDSPRILHPSISAPQEGEYVYIEAILDRAESLPNNQFSYIRLEGISIQSEQNAFSILIRKQDFEIIARSIKVNSLGGISGSPVMSTNGSVVGVVQQTQKTVYGYQIIWSSLNIDNLPGI